MINLDIKMHTASFSDDSSCENVVSIQSCLTPSFHVPTRRSTTSSAKQTIEYFVFTCECAGHYWHTSCTPDMTPAPESPTTRANGPYAPGNQGYVHQHQRYAPMPAAAAFNEPHFQVRYQGYGYTNAPGEEDDLLC